MNSYCTVFNEIADTVLAMRPSPLIGTTLLVFVIECASFFASKEISA